MTMLKPSIWLLEYGKNIMLNLLHWGFYVHDTYTYKYIHIMYYVCI